MTWENAIDSLYDQYEMKYKGSVKKLREFIFMDFEEVQINIDDSIAKTLDKFERHTQRTQAIDNIIKEYGGEELKESQINVQQNFGLIKDFTNIEDLHTFYEMINEEPYFLLINKWRGNGELSAFFNEQLPKTEKSDQTKVSEDLKIAISTVLESTMKYIDAERNGIDKLIDDINNASKEKIQLTLDKHYKVEDSRPVNSFRRKVLLDLLDDIELTQDAVDDQIVYLKSTGAHNWKPFSIVAGLYYYLFDLQSNELKLEKMITDIFDYTGLKEEYKFKKIFTQKGAQNYGAGNFSVCFLKEKFKPASTNQLVFQVRDTLRTFFYDADTEEMYNITQVDIESSTLEQDIIEGFLYADEVYYDSKIKEQVDDQTIEIFKEDFTEINYKQLIIDGAPGTGKSYGVNTEVKEKDINHERVTFYSDYEYHNFIGSILPKLNGETVTYEFVKGPFTKILNDALSRPEDKHYLIVEELTRGNAAAIFGDIFQLLDRTEEGWSEYPITHNNILESLDPEVRTFLENEYEGKVVLPPNLSIICTINSSDQNVYPLDTAFKRRFDYKIQSTDELNEFDDYKIKFGTDITVSWKDFYQKLNKYILVDLGLREDKQVGPYFIKNHKGDNNKLESIQTKLAMYMWNDLHKVHTISNKTIFKDIHTLYEVDNLFRTGSREQILNVLSEEFKYHFNLNDTTEQDN